MPEEPKPAPAEAVEKVEPDSPPASPGEGDVGDFITRHVLEKDSVFFEG